NCRQVSQLMQVASTKKFPATLESRRFFSSAIVKPLCVDTCSLLDYFCLICRPPEIPGCSGAIGLPTFPISQHFSRLRHRTLAIGDAKPVAHTEVVDWQDVRASQLEDQQHFDRPTANPTDRNEPFDDRLIVELPNDGACRHSTVECPGSQIAKRRNL